MRRSAHASGLYQFSAIGTRVVIPLHVEDIEGIQINSEVHPLGDWDYLEEREVGRPIYRSRNDGLRKRIIPRWAGRVGDRDWISFV